MSSVHKLRSKNTKETKKSKFGSKSPTKNLLKSATPCKKSQTKRAKLLT